jgi:hypothetical protein
MDRKKRAGLVKQAAAMPCEDVAPIPLRNAATAYAMHQNIGFKPTQKHYVELVLVKDATMK